MPRVVHFEIHADDPQRAARFYERVFGWKVAKWEGPVDYLLVSTGDDNEPGIDGGIVKREGNIVENMAVIGYVCTVQVDDIDAYTKKTSDAGTSIVLPKHMIPGVGYQVYCKDTEGNINNESPALSELTGFSRKGLRR